MADKLILGGLSPPASSSVQGKYSLDLINAAVHHAGAQIIYPRAAPCE